MRIEVTEDPHFNHDGRQYFLGDVVTVPDDLGKYFVATMGWAKDVEGKLEQAKRQATGEIRLFLEGAKAEVNNG